jgi:hypothetical protein
MMNFLVARRLQVTEQRHLLTDTETSFDIQKKPLHCFSFHIDESCCFMGIQSQYFCEIEFLHVTASAFMRFN